MRLNAFFPAGLGLLGVAALAQGQTLPSGYRDFSTFDGQLSSCALAVSANGSVVVGEAYGLSGDSFQAFRWTREAGMTTLGTLGGTSSSALGISADGNVVVGFADAGGGDRAFRWTAATGMVNLGVLNGGVASTATGVSADGKVVVGYSLDSVMSGYRAFRWTQATGMVDLGALNGGTSAQAYKASADGSVVVGYSLDGTANNADRAFRWTQATGMVNLGVLNGGGYSVAYGVSADGGVVVGHAQDGLANNADRAFRWTQATGMTSLGVLNGGGDSYAYSVSPDGSVVVGRALDAPSDGEYRAFRWTQATGMQTVEQWLAAAGVTVEPSFITSFAADTNADGSVVVGMLANGHAFIARVTGQGTGMIDYDDYLRTLRGASGENLLATQQADMVMHGLRGVPLHSLPRAGQMTAWTAGDWGRRDHQGDDGQIASGEIGFARGLDGQLTLKMALGRTYGTQSLAYGGRSTVKGTYALPELVWRLADRSLFATFSGYYSSGEAAIARTYLSAGAPTESTGSPDVRVTALRARLDAIDALRLGATTISPYASLTYIRSLREGYTEAGGGFPARWSRAAADTTQARVGADSAYPLNDRSRLLGRLEGVVRVAGSADGGSGQVLELNSFYFGGQRQQRAWLRASAGVEAQLGSGVATFMVNGTTEGNAASLWAHANYRIAF